MRTILALILFLPASATFAALPAVGLPADESPHSGQVEWWYYTGHLDTVDEGPAKQYAFETTVFRVAKVVLGHGELYLGQFALINVTDDQYTPKQKISLPVFATSETFNSFDLHFDSSNWVIRGSEGADSISVSDGQVGLSVDLNSSKPAALYGDHGIIDYGGLLSLAYYSRTRMLVVGEVNDHGTKRLVRGTAWMDHQWGDVDAKAYRWKWFAAQLDDGRDVMIFQVWSRATETLAKSYGAIIAQDGRVSELAESGITVTDLALWSVPGKHVRYPIRVALDSRDGDLHLTSRAYFENQRFDATSLLPLSDPYWEGACEITGTLGGLAVHGRGFSEFAGYE